MHTVIRYYTLYTFVLYYIIQVEQELKKNNLEYDIDIFVIDGGKRYRIETTIKDEQFRK